MEREDPGRGVPHFDLLEEDFPLRIEYINHDTGEVVHTDTVTGPGALHVPGKSQLGVDGQVDVRVTWGDGKVLVAD